MCLVIVLSLEKSAFHCSDKISVFTFPDCAISGHTVPSAAARKYILPALSVEEPSCPAEGKSCNSAEGSQPLAKVSLQYNDIFQNEAQMAKRAYMVERPVGANNFAFCT